ncbi:acyl carrier protein [Amycolatopsis silviterrae]|uniref:Acyl carrier protein n=1 Tax=Amycolatopsis silviterrae TaxID=1656914 RepID=A0ABW5HD79_9PSEU
MRELTYDDLMEIIRRCAGESDEMAQTTDARDIPFAELGYDSLALMETASMLQRDYGVELPDETVVDIDTPRALVELVNSRLGSAV